MFKFNLFILLIIYVPLHAAMQVKTDVNSIIQEIKLDISPVLKAPKVLKKEVTDHKNKKISIKKLEPCEICHQQRVFENNNFLPILHGQNKAYLESKILLFKNNKRSFHPFASRFQDLSPTDIAFISDFYSNKPSRLTQSLVVEDFLLDDRKNQHRLSECTACHGINGNGEELIPAISGQNTRYLAYRIREINNHSSNIHIDKNLDINCQIKRVSLIDSNHFAKILSYVSNNTDLKLGKKTYNNNCASCHENITDEVKSKRLMQLKQNISAQSQLNYMRQNIYHIKTVLFNPSHAELSREEWSNAINYLISQATKKP